MFEDRLTPFLKTCLHHVLKDIFTQCLEVQERASIKQACFPKFGHPP